MITISSEAEIILGRLSRELGDLSQREHLTPQEKRRFDAVKSQISLVKNGLNPSAIVASDVSRLKDELRGYNSRELPAEVEADYRSWFLGMSKRSYSVSKYGIEERGVVEAGTQSIMYTQGPEGGYFVPVGFDDRADAALKQYDELFDVENHNAIYTPTGAPLSVPAYDDTQNAAQVVGENTRITTTLPPPANAPIPTAYPVTLNATTFRGDIIPVSFESVQDAGVSWGALFEKIFAVRMARGVGRWLVNNLLTALNNLDTPEIIAAGAAVNTGGAQTGANSIGIPDLVQLVYGLDKAYRRGAKFYMNDNTAFEIHQLTDKMGRPIFDPDQPLESLFGWPIVRCPSLPTIAPNAPTVLFGNPHYFYVRHVARGSYVQMVTEAPGYAEVGLVGFRDFMRWDSALVAPSTTQAPFAQLVQHS